MTRFLSAAHEAGEFLIRLVETGSILSTVKVEALKGLPDADELLAWERFLLKLMLIEVKTSPYGRFDLTQPIRSTDFLVVDRLYAMCRGEPWEGHISIRCTFTTNAEEPETGDELADGDELAIVVRPFDVWSLLGVDIPLDEMKVVMREPEQFVRAFNEAVASGDGRLQIEGAGMHYLLKWGAPAGGSKSSEEDGTDEAALTENGSPSADP